MFTKLVVRNFQNHEKTVVTLGPITVVTGPSDSGKSALIRALRWMAFNRPNGVSFRRHGVHRVSVRLYEGPQFVDRRRGKGAGTYSLDGSQTYKALGGKVPGEVGGFLNLDEINFQHQHDPVFWLAKSPSEVSKALNSIVNLDQMDRSMVYLLQQQRGSAQEIRSIEGRIEKAQQDKERLSWVPDLLFRIENLRKKEKELAELKARNERLMALQGEIREQADIVAKFKPPDVSGLKEKVSKLIKLRNIRNLLEDVVSAEDQRWQAAKTMKDLNSKLNSLLSKRCPICTQSVPSSLRTSISHTVRP